MNYFSIDFIIMRWYVVSLLLLVTLCSDCAGVDMIDVHSLSIDKINTTDIIYKLQYIQNAFLEQKFPKNDFVSEDCLLAYKDSVLTGWSLLLFDATGKLEPGIAQGNFFSLGSFDECLSIQNPKPIVTAEKSFNVSGQYCLAALTLPSGLPIQWGVCMPSSCSATDFNLLMSVIGNPVNVAIKADDVGCQIKSQVELDVGDIFAIILLGIVFGTAALSTAYDYYCSTTKIKPTPILLSFSVISNGRKLFSTARNADQLECLSGMRTMSMMWIVISHTFSSITLRPLANLLYMDEFYRDGWTMYIRGATVSVDTFFLMSGIVLIYVYMKSTKENQTWFNVFQYYLHRYIRLTPALAALIFLHVTLLRYVASGPLAPMMQVFTDFCTKNWWTNLLYINNFVNNDQMCVGQTWYLAVDTQLFLLSPLVLIPLRRWKKLTLGFVALAACASIASSFAIAWIDKLRETNTWPLPTVDQTYDFMYEYYVMPHTRASPWLIGMLVGYFIYHIKVVKKSFKIHPGLNILLWIGSLAVCGTCVFYDFATDEYDRGAVSSYIAFIRPAWAIALSWIVVACVTGYGGIINSFLSMPIFQILGRLTYTLYLIHASVILIVYASSKAPVVVSNLGQMYDFWSVYMICVGCAIVWSLMFESPIIVLEKTLLTKRKPA